MHDLVCDVTHRSHRTSQQQYPVGILLGGGSGISVESYHRFQRKMTRDSALKVTPFFPSLECNPTILGALGVEDHFHPTSLVTQSWSLMF